MKVKKVNHHRNPRYPAKEHAQAHPVLLERLPARWSACRQAAAAAGMLATLAVSAGCGNTAKATTTPGPSAVQPLQSVFAVQTPEYLGEPTPPPLLGEAEAMALIERFAKDSIPGEANNVIASDIAKPIVYVSSAYSEHGSYEEAIAVHGDGAVDFYDSSMGAGFEYLGKGEYWEGNTRGKEIVPEKDKAYVLVMDEIYVGMDENEVRKQIEDFMKWLKANGIQ